MQNYLHMLQHTLIVLLCCRSCQLGKLDLLFDCVVVLQVMSACCLFLAGKVEETPKKCKDIIRTVQLLLSPEGFQAFGDDPRVCPGHRPAGV